jgi:anhydro-N-acetylmuramic acid kinase
MVSDLYRMVQAPVRQIIGLMSGTSLDGLDVAWCQIEGHGKSMKVTLRAFHTEPYDAAFKAEVQRVFAKQQIDFQHLTLLNAIVAEHQAAIVNDCLKRWNITAADIDLVASHGQTVFHAPRIFHGLEGYPDATLQIGDGDHMACRTGIITISDFRQKHIAAGGEGAPLALYGDYFLFGSDVETRFLLNIGGIANFTFLPAGEHTELVYATDTGPGNTLLDAFAQRLFGVAYDADAKLANAGIVDPALLAMLLDESFFRRPFPKTIGPELFSPAWVEAALHRLPKGSPAHNPYNLMATLTRLTAESIVQFGLLPAYANAPDKDTPVALYLSGGGAHNPLIVNHLKALLPNWKMAPMQEIGIDGDAKEAVLFAVLANECIAGTYEVGATLGGLPLVRMGKISFPS